MLEAVGEVGIKEAIEETILESNEIVETMQEAIDEHRADAEDAIKEADVLTAEPVLAGSGLEVTTEAISVDLVAGEEAIGLHGIPPAQVEPETISHQVQRVQTQSDGSASQPHSLRSISLVKATTASLPPGPPSSSTGQSVAEQEVTFRSGTADSGVASTAPTPSAAPTASSNNFPGRSISSYIWAGAAVPARTPTGSLWRTVLVGRWGGQGKARRAGLSSASATSSTYSHASSNSSDDSEPAPENSATHMLPPTRAVPSASPPAHAAPPPLPADLARMFD